MSGEVYATELYPRCIRPMFKAARERFGYEDKEKYGALLLEDDFQGHAHCKNWVNHNEKQMQKDAVTPKMTPPQAGPHLQPNDYIQAVFKSIYYNFLRTKMGLNRDLRLRPQKGDIPTFEGSGLRKASPSPSSRRPHGRLGVSSLKV